MEGTLSKIYMKDGKKIFQDNYKLFEKLIETSEAPVFVRDAIIVNKIVNGNRFYSIVNEYSSQDTKKLDKNVYNVLIDQMYSHDQLWKESDIGRGEELLRYMLTLCGVDVSEIRKIIDVENKLNIHEEEKENEYEYAYSFYLKREFRDAFNILKTLVENGAHNAAGLLGLLYYEGIDSHKDYNKALYYLSYPHIRDKKIIDKETQVIHELMDLQYKSKINCIFCVVATFICMLFTLISGFVLTNPGVAAIYLLIMAAGCAIFGFTIYKKYIYDFSLWYLLVAVMFISMLIL